MRFLLVGPEREENLSIRYLSAALRSAGHAAEIAAFDGPADIPHVLLRARGFDAVGLSICSQVRIREYLTLAAALKLQAPAVPIIAGGHYATCAAHELLEHHPDLDIIVVHEGERTVVELADARARHASLAAIPGLVFRDRGRIVRTPPRAIERELDRLPSPDRRGRVRVLAGVPTAYIMGSRGCFAACDYCCIMTLHRLAPGPRFRQRTPESVADEMARLYHERRIRQFVFHDDNFLVRSVEHNHRRLDALEAAWRARGVGRIGVTIKCRPGDVNESVFVRLKELGLVRVFLGVESASSQGLRAIGRDQSVSESAEALALCRRLGVSVQYTLMCFHPDATVATLRADLAFFRENIAHPLNFCRTEIYAGTPLEARMLAEGRARGTYLARSYAIGDSVVSDACRLATRLFRARCWTADALMEWTIGLDHLAATLRHFAPGDATEDLAMRITAWRDRANLDTVNLLDELLGICERYPGLENPALHRAARDLVQREASSRRGLLREGVALRNEATILGRISATVAPQEPKARAEGAPTLPGHLATQADHSIARAPSGHVAPATDAAVPDARTAVMRAAAAATIAMAVAGCLDGSGDGSGTAGTAGTSGSESAPARMQVDSDADGLPDLCEANVFGTDPELTDSDGDGTPDGDENHDGGSMINREEARANSGAGASACVDVEDSPCCEKAAEPMDVDGDGLPDSCEAAVFRTDPRLADTDGNGIIDGAENHDGGTMVNAEEARVSMREDDECHNVSDAGPTAPLPAMTLDSDLDGLPDICETEVFGTDPSLVDTDGNGIDDGYENHDGGSRNNLAEAQDTPQWEPVCVDVNDTLPI